MIMYELLAYKKPFQEEKNKNTIVIRVCKDETFRPSFENMNAMAIDTMSDQIISEWKALIQWSWSSDPSKRPSFRELRSELERLKEKILQG